MQKETIYIDVEDDITSVISKVKKSKAESIYLVPPKRIGLLNSAVNLRLLQRAASNSDKKLTIVTSNKSLESLAAIASIPVAKSLNAKAELGKPITVEDDDEDNVIDGAELPVGEHAATAKKPNKQDELEKDLDELNIDDDQPVTPLKPSRLAKTGAASAGAASAAAASKNAAGKPKKAVKVPNFDTFRKKLIIGILTAVLLIGALVWAIIFAPNAKIIITANTMASAATGRLTLSDANTDLGAKNIKLASKTIQKDISVPFVASGKKEVGDKAKGTVVFSTGTIRFLREGGTIPAGTVVTSESGAAYTTDGDVTLTLGNAEDGVGVAVTAQERGSKYNGATGKANVDIKNVDARFKGATGGGSDKTVSVVTDADIKGAIAKAHEQHKDDDIKKELTGQFSKDDIVLPETYSANYDAIKPNVGVDQEAGTNQLSVTGKASYAISSVPRTEISKYLDQFFKAEIDGKANQKVYSNGADKATITNITNNTGALQANLSANGKIGPNIQEKEVIEFSKKKSFGDIQSKYEAVNGVENVDVKFSPFWVSTVPDDDKRVKVEFNLNEKK